MSNGNRCIQYRLGRMDIRRKRSMFLESSLIKQTFQLLGTFGSVNLFEIFSRTFERKDSTSVVRQRDYSSILEHMGETKKELDSVTRDIHALAID